MMSFTDIEKLSLTGHCFGDALGPCLGFLQLPGQVRHLLGNALSAFGEARHELLNVFPVDIGCHIRGVDLRADTLEFGKVAVQRQNTLN